MQLQCRLKASWRVTSKARPINEERMLRRSRRRWASAETGREEERSEEEEDIDLHLRGTLARADVVTEGKAGHAAGQDQDQDQDDDVASATAGAAAADDD
mmetsp:Transcript_65863/g.137530  ORF Transcript_65863/g.137530 Transcript_65863/m.137530 type:complete len:100 (-) Transcript_65863:1088-1387(-)